MRRAKNKTVIHHVYHTNSIELSVDLPNLMQTVYMKQNSRDVYASEHLNTRSKAKSYMKSLTYHSKQMLILHSFPLCFMAHSAIWALPSEPEVNSVQLKAESVTKLLRCKSLLSFDNEPHSFTVFFLFTL